MLQAILIAIPAFLLFLVVEGLVGHRRGLRIYEAKDTATSISMGLGKLILGVGVDALILIVLVAVRHGSETLLHIPTFSMAHWWQWALAVLAFDFCFYWMHRLHHTVRIGWAGHVTHHSSERYNYATALRQSWTEHLTAIPFWLPMAVIGFPAETVLLVYAISLLYQFLIHTELVRTLGPLEWVFNTPSHHRVHHGSDLKYLDRNFGGTLIVWDRLFGTFQKEEEPVTYGLIENIRTYNVFRVAFHEWIAMFKDAFAATHLLDKLRTFIKPPGWLPGDDSQTVRVQQQALHTRLASPAGERADHPAE